MKKIFFILLFLLPLLTRAQTYYISSFAGDDTRTATQAQNSATPWRTLVNLTTSFMNTLGAGDKILLQAGGSYYGGITITADGSSGNPVTIGSYGSGTKPVITGETAITSWSNVGANIWESSAAASPLSELYMVTINGVNTPMGRYPDNGYVTYQSHSGNTSITASGLSAATQNWSGAFLAIRKYRWIIEKDSCTNHSGTTLTFVDSNNGNDPQNGYGVIVTSHPATLTTQNEWYFNPTTRKLRIYSTSSPTNVKIATVNDLIYMVSKDYITIDNISFQYANKNGISNENAESPVITNCDFQFMGFMATNTRMLNIGANAPNQRIENCTARDCNDAGFYLSNSTDAIVRNNTLDNIGVYANMGKPTVVNFAGSTFQGITADGGDDVLVEYNSIDSVGYIGIKTRGGSTIQYNYVNYHNFVKDDGGGIYLNPLNKGMTYSTKGYVRYNIVLNAVGAAAGTNSANPEGHGIYNDEAMDNTDYTGNTVAYSSSYGLFMNQNNRSNITNNIVFDAKRGLTYQKYDNAYPFAGNVITGNTLVARGLTQYPAYYEPMAGSMPAGTINNNVYAQPLDNTADVVWWDFNGGNNYGTLPEWRTASGKDANSTLSPFFVDNVNKERLEFNATQSPKTISLGATYIGVSNGTTYAGSITLQPYTGQVLLLTGTNSPPVANAGTDKTITLPTNSATLNGSGTDADGTITGYAWIKLTGTGGSITNASSATATATGLTAGGYTYQLTVTDNNGGTDTDVMSVTVNPAPNQNPTANAGANQNIQLPTNSVTLSGSGNDPDGTITGYAWTKISGAGGTISSPTSASTNVTGLTQGVYVFRLTVTDNSGGTGSDDVQVTVVPAANIPPTANAGSNQTITLPTSMVTLSGSGTDTDGSIVGYLWSKVSGTGSTIVSPTSQTTSVNGLSAGVYVFRLTVTDNVGATGTDDVQITVNAAPVVPPVADAGTDKVITLPTSSAALNGSGTDADGTIVSYLWVKLGGSPSGGTIANPNAAVTSVSGLVQGVYTYRLTVTDNVGSTDTDDMTITVNPAPNQPPTANAGANQIITLPTNSVNLVGSGNDPDGSITGYLWTKVSGGSATITTPTTASTSVTGLVQGTYVFRLTVTDNSSATGFDDVQVLVLPASNVPPTANAGTNQTITLPVSQVTLSGTGTDTDGTIVGWGWTKISGTGGTIVSPSSQTTSATGLTAGVYVFELTVTDNSGAIGTDQVQITVNPAPVVLPTANAGTDVTIFLPTNSVALNGSGTGTGISFLWTKLTGTGGAITSPTSAVTSATGLTAGTYTFELRVTDNVAAVARDTMQVTVTPSPDIPPVVSAGANVTLTLPNNLALLVGTATAVSGTIVSQTWVQVTGTAATINSPSSLSTTVTFTIAGTYTFSLTGTDSNALSAADTVTVTILPAPDGVTTPIIFFQGNVWPGGRISTGFTAYVTIYTKKFEVQKKISGTYKNLCVITPDLNLIDYWCLDLNAKKKGKYYYRIKVYDLIGSKIQFYYTPVLTVIKP